MLVWRPQVEALLDKGLRPKAIFDRLRLEQAEFQGSYATVKRLTQAIARERGVKPDDVAIAVETDPGALAE